MINYIYVLLIVFEEPYCSLSQLHSVIIYVTFSASVAQTVAVSVIGSVVVWQLV